jgi:2-oxoisovalerate dehydrogenase E1 component
VPLGKATIVQAAHQLKVDEGSSCCIITYGMGVYWALQASAAFAGSVEIVDLRSLYPLDEDLVFSVVKKHGKCIVLTEEQKTNSFAEALAYRISRYCFQWLDAPVEVIGSLDIPAVPMNMVLEKAMLPDVKMIGEKIHSILHS